MLSTLAAAIAAALTTAIVGATAAVSASGADDAGTAGPAFAPYAGSYADASDQRPGWGGPPGWLSDGDRPAHVQEWIDERLAVLPAALRRDLRQALAIEDDDARWDALEAVHARALAGDYGTEAQQVATLRQEVQAAWEIEADDERRAAFDAIRERALAGEFGATVQDRAQTMGDGPWGPPGGWRAGHGGHGGQGGPPWGGWH